MTNLSILSRRMSASELGLSVGRKQLARDVEQQVSEFLDIADLHSLFLSSKGLGSLVSRWITRARNFTVDLGLFLNHEPAFALVSRTARSLQRITIVGRARWWSDSYRHEKKIPKGTAKAEKWLRVLFKRNRLSLRAVLDDEPLHAQTLAVLVRSPNLEECAVTHASDNLNRLDTILLRVSNLRLLRKLVLQNGDWQPHEQDPVDEFAPPPLPSYVAYPKALSLFDSKFPCLTDLTLQYVGFEAVAVLAADACNKLRQLEVEFSFYNGVVPFGFFLEHATVLRDALCRMKHLSDLTIEQWGCDLVDVDGQQWNAMDWPLPNLTRLSFKRAELEYLPRIVAPNLLVFSLDGHPLAAVSAISRWVKPSLQELRVCGDSSRSLPEDREQLAELVRALDDRCEKLFCYVAAGGFPTLTTFQLNLPRVSPYFGQALIRRPDSHTLRDLSLRLPQATSADEVALVVCCLPLLQTLSITRCHVFRPRRGISDWHREITAKAPQALPVDATELYKGLRQRFPVFLSSLENAHLDIANDNCFANVRFLRLTSLCLCTNTSCLSSLDLVSSACPSE